MAVTVRSFAKINLGLRIGARRADGFHDLVTVYQTVALADTIRVTAGRGGGIEIRCNHPDVPWDESNTCYRVADRVLHALKARARITIDIDKKLPVQGGLGAASSNAVVTMLAIERALAKQLSCEARLRIAAEVGSDLPLFLVGGTVLGIGRGENVLPLQDLPVLACVVATPKIGVSTPDAFGRWDDENPEMPPKLTGSGHSDRMNEFSRALFSWLCSTPTGVPAQKGGDRAEAPLLDLVRAGIENDFERVVFPQYPELRAVKRALEREGAQYASLSGSGSAVYGLFAGRAEAAIAAERLNAAGTPAQATLTLPRREYWQKVWKQ